MTEEYLPAVIVETSNGPVSGTDARDGAVFLGIPYAAPPVGERRYVSPQPALAWNEILEANRFAPVMPQPLRSLPGVNTPPFIGPGWNGEDPQLVVNVWTPGGKDRPVMVFFHGGAFVAGAPSAPIYDGAAFARDGVVFVSASYRLGIEGFLVLEGGETNVALRDQLAALEWVQREIATFGGDPHTVTAFGQSAGAMTLGCLLGSKHSRGLFHAAISQSGGTTLSHSREQAATVARHAAGLLGVEPTKDAFSRVPLAQVIEAQAKLLPGTVKIENDPTGGMLALLPVRDGDVVPHAPLADLSDVPLLIGDTTEEGNLYFAGVPNVDMAAAEPMTRTIFREPTAALAHAHPGNTWRYEFAWRSNGVNGRLGAAHAMELPFVFDTLAAPGLKQENGLLGPEGGPQALADRVHAAWVRFGTHHDPGWPQDRQERFD